MQLIQTILALVAASSCVPAIVATPIESPQSSRLRLRDILLARDDSPTCNPPCSSGNQCVFWQELPTCIIGSPGTVGEGVPDSALPAAANNAADIPVDVAPVPDPGNPQTGDPPKRLVRL